MQLAARAYTDGVYTGPSSDAYYGIVQIQVLVQGARVTALNLLKYPNDRRTSVNVEGAEEILATIGGDDDDRLIGRAAPSEDDDCVSAIPRVA
jgi:uncharacterized protein with FMN-binding domain